MASSEKDAAPEVGIAAAPARGGWRLFSLGMVASKIYRIAAQAARAAAIKIAQLSTSCYLLLATNSG
jgi:hypothetical protein